MITIGMTHTVTRTVTPDMTARAVGSGATFLSGTAGARTNRPFSWLRRESTPPLLRLITC